MQQGGKDGEESWPGTEEASTRDDHLLKESLMGEKLVGEKRVGYSIHPTPPHPTPPWRFHLMLWRSHLMLWRFQLLGVPSYWAFPVTGRSHGLAAAPGHGQVALGANKVARGPHTGPRRSSAT